MLRHNLLPIDKRTAFVSEQGTKMGRRSFLHVRIASEEQAIDVGGYTAPFSRAVMQL
jgi:predicted PhzF superfamily epimerase YddE/YHI9